VTTTITATSVTFEDGSGYDKEDRDVQRRPHHTAIVAACQSPNRIVVFEQHVKPLGERVQKHSVAVTDSIPAVETSFRRMKDKAGNMRQAKVVVTTAVKVTGRI
jgi:hypothetical protein